MDAQYHPRGNHGHGHVTHGRGRPYNDNRQQQHGSPPFSTPNSSHHDSPQSETSYQRGRGGWGGQQHYHNHK